MTPLALIFNLPIFFIILRKKYLTFPGGITAAAVLGLSLFIIQPFFWIVLCIFFFSSSILSKVKTNEKSDTVMEFAKGSSQRDALQVVANSLVPFLFAIGYGVTEFLPKLIDSNVTQHNPLNPFFIGVFVAFAVHTADTWATEIGILSKRSPRLITNLHKIVARGTSGGITIDGCAASIFGAGLVAIVYLAIVILAFPNVIINGRVIMIICIIAIGGFLGSIIDSIEGASIQGIYYCNYCEKETETNPHKRCGNETLLSRGFALINNDLVNMSSALVMTICIYLITFTL